VSNSQHERLLVVAHGTAAAEGSATTSRLVAAVAAARPDITVDLCFLDVVAPRLADALAESDDRPTVVVPLLLSTGYHVQTDIPAAVAPYRSVRVATHLGPDPLLVDALVDRLASRAGDTAAASTALVGVGSSRPDAAAELAAMGDLLAARLDRPVITATISTELAATLAALPAPLQVAAYLLAEGQFLDTLRTAVAGRGSVTDPIGVHPALVDLVWERYDAANR
jgi:sirohydrochlorin ferrochelatase